MEKNRSKNSSIIGYVSGLDPIFHSVKQFTTPNPL